MMNLQTLVGTELPVIQAPMAGVQGSALAVAVSNAGALGSLPGAMLTPDALRQELTTIRAQTMRPYNVNFFCHAQPAMDPAREAAWRAALAQRPSVRQAVDSSYPQRLQDFLRARGGELSRRIRA